MNTCHPDALGSEEPEHIRRAQEINEAYHTIPARFHATGGWTMAFAPCGIFCVKAALPSADPFGHMECLYPSTPNICCEKNILRYIISKIRKIWAKDA